MPLRVALFTDTFQEINGVALTSRQFVEFARRHDYPLLCIRGSDHTSERTEGSVTHHELERSRYSIRLDRGLLYDPVLWRSANKIADVVANFKPDIIHVVSPGDVSTVGLYVARKLKIPLAISWHTNLHEFAAMRLEKTLSWLPESLRKRASRVTEVQTLRGFLAFYRLGDVLFAPNAELVTMLQESTGKSVFLMKRGIDTHLFNPVKRTVEDGILRIGYVGRITPEKSVRFLADLETALVGVPAKPREGNRSVRFPCFGNRVALGALCPGNDGNRLLPHSPHQRHRASSGRLDHSAVPPLSCLRSPVPLPDSRPRRHLCAVRGPGHYRLWGARSEDSGPIANRELREVVKEFALYYNRGRPHYSLGPGIPEPLKAMVPAGPHRHKLPPGYRVTSRAVLGGLHHEYGLQKEAA